MHDPTEIDKEAAPFHEVSIELVSKRSNKVTQLVGNNDPNVYVDGKRQWYQIDFVQPIFLRGVQISATGYESWHEIEFEIIHIDGTTHIQSIRFDSGVSSLALGKLVSGLRFRPSERFSLLSSPKIHKILLLGLTLEEFHAYEWAVKSYENDLADLRARESAFEELKEQVTTLETKKASIESEIGKSRAELEILNSKLTEMKQSISASTEKLTSVQESIRTYSGEREEVFEELVSSAKELETLKGELKIFPSQIAGFVEEGNRTIRWYLGLSVPFSLIIIFVAYSLFFSAVDLTQLYKAEPNLDIWSVFLTRLPFVLVSLAILEVCGYIVGRLIFEIVKVNRQRLNLSKLSIVARDVSSAASHGLDFSKDELYEREVKLKMELLREHIKEYIGQEFEYKGTLLSSVVSSVVERARTKKDPQA